MMSLMDAEYVLSSGELAVLLAAAGSEGLSGFALEGAGNMERSQVFQQLHGLFRKELLCRSTDERLEIAPVLRLLIDACAYCGGMVRIWSLYPVAKPFVACYRGAHGWLVMRPCETLPAGWLLHGTDAEGILRLLADCDLLPGVDQEMQRLREALPVYWENRGSEAGQPLLQLEWVDVQTGTTLEVVTILRCALEDRLEIAAQGTVKSVRPYLPERLLAWLEGVGKGELGRVRT